MSPAGHVNAQEQGEGRRETDSVHAAGGQLLQQITGEIAGNNEL